MNETYAAYLGELKKIMWRKKYMVFLFIGFFICILWAIVGSLISGVALNFVGMPMGHVPTPISVLPFFAQVLIPLLIFMGASDLITAETSIIKSTLSRPVARYKLYSGKMLAITTYVAFYLACIYVVSAFLNQLLTRATGTGRPLGLLELVDAFFAYVLTVPPLLVLTLFAGFIALFGRSPSLTMFLLVVLYIIMRVLPIAFPIFSELLFTSHIGWYRLFVGISPTASRLVHMLLILVGYGAVLFTAGSLIFDKKEY